MARYKSQSGLAPIPRKSKEDSPEAIVGSLSREDLEALVLQRLEGGDTALASAILLRHGAADGGKAQALVQTIVGNHESGESYGYYDNSEGLADELFALRRRAMAQVEPAKHTESFALLRAVVEEIAPHCWQGDDHDGVLVGTVQQTIDDIIALASRRNCDPACRKDIRAWARANADSRWAIEGDSWDFELLRLQLLASRGKDERRESLDLLRTSCAPPENGQMDSYRARKSAETILQALRHPRDAKERASFIAEHLHLGYVRDMAITEALAAKDYTQAEELAIEGMRIEASRGGGSDAFALRLVEVLDSSGSKARATEFVEKQTIMNSSLEWFTILKKRIAKGPPWQTVRERVIASVATRSPSFHAQILDAEGLIKDLAELARAHPSVLGQHYKRIGREVPELAAGYLEGQVRRELVRTHSRNGYRYIADKVREYAGFAGKEAAFGLVEDLCSRYSNRPAMIQELRAALAARQAGPTRKRW